MHKGLKLTGPATAGRQLWGGGEGGLNVRYLFYTPTYLYLYFSVCLYLCCICICIKGATDSKQTDYLFLAKTEAVVTIGNFLCDTVVMM